MAEGSHDPCQNILLQSLHGSLNVYAMVEIWFCDPQVVGLNPDGHSQAYELNREMTLKNLFFIVLFPNDA